MRLWAVDASPLLFLAKLDRLALLRKSADRVVVPATVLLEICEDPDAAKQRAAAARQAWLAVETVKDRRALDGLLADLDVGEAEAIALALETGAERLVLDDLAARRQAHRMGVATIGTPGLLLAARLRGDLPSLRAEIDRLRQAGFRLHPELATALLNEAGEA